MLVEIVFHAAAPTCLQRQSYSVISAPLSDGGVAIHWASPLPAAAVGATARSGLSCAATAADGIALSSFEKEPFPSPLTAAYTEEIFSPIYQCCNGVIIIIRCCLPTSTKSLIGRAPLHRVACNSNTAIIRLQANPNQLPCHRPRPVEPALNRRPALCRSVLHCRWTKMVSLLDWCAQGHAPQ